ncbi:uncharacterized protein At4g04775-like [Arabidopsis lyrata subsp. lyrata]|uniref:uncharacterized protein At4g04775-like n=1 Tax=Arabidopsis lyrata subsp. lyrata TaxID=81972 RepID=UPI000A29BDB4|nr:uncharacterized protein At4g04775-like [Arabidopsis lyrata subsp. lyrata]|eukprot:XP_020885910.1 uncharacterized protein At4g04775-like [Arabidopsis lyrata subsp. lyrata]
MVNEKCKRFAENPNALRVNVMANMELHNKNIKQMEEELIKKMEGELLTMKENVEELGHVMAKSALKIVGIAAVIVTSIVWLWGRV